MTETDAEQKAASNEESVSGETRRPSTLKDAVGLISGVGGLFVVILWLAGRQYAAGYFAAMNIPSFVVSFSVWEYAEVSWMPLVLFSVVTIVGGSLSAILLSLILSLLAILLSPILSPLARAVRRLVSRIKPSQFRVPFVKPLIAMMLGLCYWAIMVGYLLLLVSFSLMWARAFGETASRQYLLNSAPQIEIVTDAPLPLGTPMATGSPALYAYQGLRLATHNDGKYYLFSELDPATCRPKQVYVVRDEQCVQVNILPASPIALQCQGDSEQTPAPTPSPGAEAEE